MAIYKINSIEAAMASMAEPEHSNNKGLDHSKWAQNPRAVARLKRTGQFSAAAKDICDSKGLDSEEFEKYYEQKHH